MGLDPIIINNTPFELLTNGSVATASYTVYTIILGDWFWVILLVFLLGITYLRTEDTSYVFTYGLLGLLGLGAYGFFPDFFKPTLYLIMSISLALTLYAFFVRQEN